MALLNSDGKYIKIIDTEGNFEVYETAESREVNKVAPDPEDILAKYDELILEAQNSYEKYLIDNNIAYKNDEGILIPLDETFTEDSFTELLKNDTILSQLYTTWTELLEEKHFYEEDLFFKDGCKHEYKYMIKYYPDIKNSLPKVIEQAWTEINGSTIEEMYEDAKRTKRFGDTEDV